MKKTSLVISVAYDNNGIYQNDRDAWTEGAFMSDFAKEIVADPSLAASNDNLLLSTARSIASQDITNDGYYGGSWQGPTGTGSIWTEKGALPEQIMTSGSTAHVLVAAAVLSNLKSQN
ncbi:hypothetical protein ACUNWD_11600 [Sunxiuqinia sp. A32]|uniref:hypothetical protein n=1 Tax=Sunxiuqinia sp. A32 TaxID=3461496 RepID=UPI004045C499